MSEYKRNFKVSITVKYSDDTYSNTEVCKHETTVNHELGNLRKALQDSVDQAMYGAKEYVKQFKAEEEEVAVIPAWKQD